MNLDDVFLLLLWVGTFSGVLTLGAIVEAVWRHYAD